MQHATATTGNVNTRTLYEPNPKRAALSFCPLTKGAPPAISPLAGIKEESVGNRRGSSTAPARAELGATPRYMIAVGGAGSSGRPALASGTRIITATSAAKAIKGATAESPMAR